MDKMCQGFCENTHELLGFHVEIPGMDETSSSKLAALKASKLEYSSECHTKHSHIR